MRSFRSALTSLWLRLMSLSIVGILFAYAVFLAKHRIQGWTFYLTTSEVLFEVLVRLLFAAIVAMVLGTVVTALLTPLLGLFTASRPRVLEAITKIAVLAVIFVDSRYAVSRVPCAGSGSILVFILKISRSGNRAWSFQDTR